MIPAKVADRFTKDARNHWVNTVSDQIEAEAKSGCRFALIKVPLIYRSFVRTRLREEGYTVEGENGDGEFRVYW